MTLIVPYGIAAAMNNDISLKRRISAHFKVVPYRRGWRRDKSGKNKKHRSTGMSGPVHETGNYPRRQGGKVAEFNADGGKESASEKGVDCITHIRRIIRGNPDNAIEIDTALLQIGCIGNGGS